jgi:hypothetical protein
MMSQKKIATGTYWGFRLSGMSREGVYEYRGEYLGQVLSLVD